MTTNHKPIFEEVAEKTGEDLSFVRQVIWCFSFGIKQLFKKRRWIKISGYFTYRLKKKYYPVWKTIHDPKKER